MEMRFVGDFEADRLEPNRQFFSDAGFNVHSIALSLMYGGAGLARRAAVLTPECLHAEFIWSCFTRIQACRSIGSLLRSSQ
jgi:hypothetical protein